MTAINQSFTTDQVAGSGTPQHIDLGFKPHVMFMTGCAVPTASIGTSFYANAWGGFGWSPDPAYLATSLGSGGYQAGVVPGGSYISDSIFAGLYSNTDLRAKSIDLVSMDCDTSTGHTTSGYTFNTAILPTQVVPTIALGGDNIGVATGSFSWPGSAGNVVISGLAFQPQLVMLLWSKTDTFNRPYTFGDANGSSFGFGAASSSSGSNQFAFYTNANGGTGGGWTVHAPGSVAVVQDYTNVLASAVLASMNSDGFTLTFDGPDTGETLSVVPRLVGWIALADSVGGFHVGTSTIPGSTGNVGYTGCGFQPDQVITAHGNAAAANTVEVGGSWGIGMFDQYLQSCVLNGENLIPFNQYSARRHNATAIAFGALQTTTCDGEASAVSLDSDGFSLNWTNVTAAGKPWGWIAMKTTGTNFGGTCGGVSSTFVPQIYRRL